MRSADQGVRVPSLVFLGSSPFVLWKGNLRSLCVAQKSLFMDGDRKQFSLPLKLWDGQAFSHRTSSVPIHLTWVLEEWSKGNNPEKGVQEKSMKVWRLQRKPSSLHWRPDEQRQSLYRAESHGGMCTPEREGSARSPPISPVTGGAQAPSGGFLFAASQPHSCSWPRNAGQCTSSVQADGGRRKGVCVLLGCSRTKFLLLAWWKTSGHVLQLITLLHVLLC